MPGRLAGSSLAAAAGAGTEPAGAAIAGAAAGAGAATVWITALPCFDRLTVRRSFSLYSRLTESSVSSLRFSSSAKAWMKATSSVPLRAPLGVFSSLMPSSGSCSLGPRGGPCGGLRRL